MLRVVDALPDGNLPDARVLYQDLGLVDSGRRDLVPGELTGDVVRE